ncbi:uncharacterized protein LOC120847453 [Ixodes scapularis]|uniref:uncharacterized protein LOC120847453 n=1 Tax=Ixodes scapularis TaxID=6945 RepID=UPI001C38055A|nr:uncharacterized protein LOC120847453 [Ixodes scapularis]
MGIEYVRNSLNILRKTSSSSTTQRVIRDLKPYVDAYATAILRLLLLYIEEIFSHAREATRGMAVGARTAAKITAVMLVSLCNYAAVRVKFSQNNKPQDVINLLVEESNRLYTSNVENGVYRCDTDYMTLRTVMPAERVTDDVNIIDPAISTTLRDHNELIMKSSDTIPVPRTNHYVLALQKEKAPATEVSVLNIASIIEQCMSNGRVDSRFVEVHKQSDQGTQELNKFYSQACCVSPRNLGLFLQCLNFEMMDSDMFGATLQCLKMTKGIPTPRQEEIATYSNTALFRMATNLFYHTRFCRSYRGENTYLYDSRFFNDFLLWVQSPNCLEHHISPSVSSSIISWCTSMSTAMHTTRDANGAKCAMAAISTCEVDQRVLADFLNMFIKLFIEDETEISVINKKFLEKELLEAFASVSNCYNLFRGQFVSATALRLFLARCRWSVADDVEVIVPVETKFLNRLICDSDDLLSNSMRDKLRKTMEDVSTMMAPLLSNPSTSAPHSKDDDSNVHDVICTKHYVYLYVRHSSAHHNVHAILPFLHHVLQSYVNDKTTTLPLDYTFDPLEEQESFFDVIPVTYHGTYEVTTSLPALVAKIKPKEDGQYVSDHLYCEKHWMCLHNLVVLRLVDCFYYITIQKLQILKDVTKSNITSTNDYGIYKVSYYKK